MRPCARCGSPARSVASAQSASSRSPAKYARCRLHRCDAAGQHHGAATADRELGLDQRLHERIDILGRPGAVRVRCRRRSPAESARPVHGDRGASRELAAAADQRDAIRRSEIRQRRQFDHVGESIRERGIERQRALVAFFWIGVCGERRIHRRPAVAQLRQREPLDALLVDHREQLVLRLRTAARDLVQEHTLARPTGRPACAGNGSRCASRPAPDSRADRRS